MGNHLSDEESVMISKKWILIHMIEPHAASKYDFTETLHKLAKDNPKVSKLIAKFYVKKVNQMGQMNETNLNKLASNIRKFFSITDDYGQNKLEIMRLEWVLGVPQIMMDLS